MPQAGTRVFARLPAFFTVRPRSLQAYALAVAWTGAAFLIRYALGFLDAEIPPYSTFFAAILLTAIMAGVAAGVTAAALGLAVSWFAFGNVTHAYTIPGLALYTVSAGAIIWIADQYRGLLRRVQDDEAEAARQMELIAAENEILSLIAADAPMTGALERLAQSIEAYSNGEMIASVLLMDAGGRRLRHGAAPSLPGAYNAAIDGLEIGPAAGSCGTAAYTGKPVYVTDIQSDPRWAAFRELAAGHGLAACWSIPILSHDGSVMGTLAVYHRRPRTPEAQEMEIVALMSRIAGIAIQHEHDRQQQQMLVDELAHRVKNLQAVVGAIAGSTLRPHTDAQAYATFEQRLSALSRAQSLLTERNWSSVDLRELVESIAVTPFETGGGRFVIDGPRVALPSRHVLPFSLALHELCTNATKYGALSKEGGRVHMEWDLRPKADDAHSLIFKWREADGPPVSPPERQGFGGRMLRQAFAAVAGAELSLDYAREGVMCTISLPIGPQRA